MGSHVPVPAAGLDVSVPISAPAGKYARSVRRVYLAGPPFADEYRRRAASLVRELGWEPVDPMRRDFRGGTEGNEAAIVEGDLEDIDSCDAVLAAFTAADEGTAMEAWYARSRGKPVVVYTGGAPPHPWTVYVAASVWADLERAVQALDGL
jgi:nucleoside 2-deoxyribosyltransferase